MRIPASLSILPLLALLAVPAGPAAGEAPGPPGGGPIPASVTLEEAVRLALSRSREIRLAGQEARIAGEERAKAGAGRLPRIDASGEFTALSEPPSFFLQGREQQFGDRNVSRARLTAEQTLFDFGRTSSRIAGAEARLEAARLREERTRELRAFEAVSAYLAARRAERLRTVAGESLETARAHRKVAGDLYELGVVAKNDVLAAEVQVANDEAARVTADNRVELSRSRLALAMGYPGDAAVSPAPGPIPVPAGEVPPLGESLAAASANRREIRAAEAALREGEARAEAARAAFAPSFFGQGGYAYESDSFNPNPHVFSALVGGKVNLFAGGADRAERREALLELDRRREELALLRDRIALEVKRAHLAVLEAAGRLAAAEVAVARAEENLRIQEDRYREGLSISTEMLDAQTLLSRAKADRENAAFDLYEARFGLLLARGELLMQFAPPPAAGGAPAAPGR
ncbi:MAG: TolC family protein [Deltaproteobacteria bacterium]